MKYYHLAGFKTRLAMAVRFRPQLVRKSQYTLLIGILFCTLGWKQIRYFPSCSYLIRYALPKERKGYVGLRIHWSNPCRFNSCRLHQMKTKVSDIRKNRRFFLFGIGIIDSCLDGLYFYVPLLLIKIDYILLLFLFVIVVGLIPSISPIVKSITKKPIKVINSED